jgi:hypothetical protein
MNSKRNYKLFFWITISIAFLITGGHLFSRLTSSTASPLVINEFMAANGSGLTDEDGDSADWIEIYNRSNRAVNLSGWALTNNPAQPDKWPFPDYVLDSHAYLVVFASGKSRYLDEPGQALHTNFKLSRQGEFLALYNILEDRLTDVISLQGSDQFQDISFGLAEDGLRHAYLTTPTPGEANSEVLAWAENISSAAADLVEEGGFQVSPEVDPASPLFDTTGQAASGEGMPLAFADPSSLGLQTPGLPSENLTNPIPPAAAGPTNRLRITEMMYNPLGGDEYEFIELKNTGDQPVELAGAFFEGINYVFPFDTLPLPPGELVVLVRNREFFARQYPNVLVTDIYDGHFSNQGERITLRDYAGNVIDSVEYDDENNWPLTPDGWGDSLVLVDPEIDPDDPTAWRASLQLYGLPGDNGMVANIISSQAPIPTSQTLAAPLDQPTN